MTYGFYAVLGTFSAAGVKCNNLFQLDDGTWRCNVRDAQGTYEFFDHPDAIEAMKGALAKVGIEAPVEDFGDLV